MTPVPEDFEVPFGKARVRREGQHLSIITYGNTVHFSLEAAEILAKEGYEVEVLDLRSLNPLDYDSIVATAKKTHRVLVVHEDKVFGGFGGELVGVINERAFEHLDAPVRRVGSTFTPVGFNRILERATLPDMNRILVAARELIQY
jgi:2-oxoisovalerate dehydrogenase E1 component